MAYKTNGKAISSRDFFRRQSQKTKLKRALAPIIRDGYTYLELVGLLSRLETFSNEDVLVLNGE